MLRFASALLLACTTAKKICTSDADCKNGQLCNLALDGGVCDKPLDSLVVELVGA